MSSIIEDAPVFKAKRFSKQFLMDLLARPPDSVPVLRCRRASDLTVQTEACAYCGKTHAHGLRGLLADGGNAWRVAHCTIPTLFHGCEGNAALTAMRKRWEEIKQQGYELKLI